MFVEKLLDKEMKILFASSNHGKLQEINTTLYGCIRERGAKNLGLEKGNEFVQYVDFERNAVVLVFEEE